MTAAGAVFESGDRRKNCDVPAAFNFADRALPRRKHRLNDEARSGQTVDRSAGGCIGYTMPFSDDVIIKGNVPCDDPIIWAVYTYWLSKCREDAIPDRSIVDPVEIPFQCLPHLILWERLADGGYRCRLAGTAVVDAHAKELRGMTTADLHGAQNAVMESEYDWTVQNRQPHYVERWMTWFQRDNKRYRRLLLPLTHGGTSVDILLAVATYGAVTTEALRERRS
jgi:hypothetical protein